MKFTATFKSDDGIDVAVEGDTNDFRSLKTTPIPYIHDIIIIKQLLRNIVSEYEDSVDYFVSYRENKPATRCGVGEAK